MKISRIAALNYQRLSNVNVHVRAPLLLLAGANEQGKTSLADAIYHAFNGEARRVKLKKDFGDLVHDGQKTGLVTIEVMSPTEGEKYLTVKVPQDKRTSDIDVPELMRLLLDASVFPGLPSEERRKVLFGITGTRISGKTILEELKKKGADPGKASQIGSVLLAGFDAAHTEAKTKATEARGSWKAITNEAYGVKKAPEWKAPVTTAYDAQRERLPALRQEVTDQTAKIVDLTNQQATLAAQRRQFSEQEQRRAQLKDKADGLNRAKTKLTTDQSVVDEWEKQVAETRALAEGSAAVQPLTCPHCAGLVDLKDGKLAQHVPPEKVADAKSKALLPEYEATLKRVTQTRDNSKRDVTAAEGAAAVIADLEKNGVANVAQSEIEDATTALNTARQHLVAIEATIKAMDDEKAKQDAAETTTKKALGYHTDAVQWDQIADWLAPSGIQSELLVKALEPFNDRLKATATTTGWDLVTIDADMTIRVGGRNYSLASASAKWRAQAALVEAMSFVSGIKTFLLDEVELLIGDVRMSFLKWMHGLAARGEVDTGILIGSFKEPPQCPPTFQVEWVKDGMAGEQPEAQEAA